MTGSQAQVRWFAAALLLVVVVIGPVTAGLLFSEPATEFTVFDLTSWDADDIANLEAAVEDTSAAAIFRTRSGDECAGDACTSFESPEKLPATTGATMATRTDSPATKFVVFDVRSWDEDSITGLKEAVDSTAMPAMFLVRPARKECESNGTACPPLDSDMVEVPMSPGVRDTAGRLDEAYDELEVKTGPVEVRRAGDAFDGRAAVVTGALLLIGTLLAVTVLAARQPRRPAQTPGHLDPPPLPALVPQDKGSTPRQPSRRPVTSPALALADLPGVHEVVREHGSTAKVRSHVDSTGGYVALGDVLVWAAPGDAFQGDFAAFPDDDVLVTVAAWSAPVTPTLDGGLLP